MYSGVRSSRTSGSRRTGSYRSSRSMQRFAPRFATVGFNRDVEKKYNDRVVQSYNPIQSVMTAGAGVPNQAMNGVMWTSNQVWQYIAGGGTTGPLEGETPGDMLKTLVTGTTVQTRIGNKIKARYLKGAITFNAATVTNSTTTSNNAQNGESIVEPTSVTELVQYMRTTFRWCVVKDLQVNSTTKNVLWTQVFENGDMDGVDGNERPAGVHSELNIENMGRFVILRDEYFDLDAKCPQKTIPFYIKGSEIGEVRYNGPDKYSYTDKGIYIIWAACTLGVLNSVNSNCVLGGPIWHSRLCFTDA